MEKLQKAFPNCRIILERRDVAKVEQAAAIPMVEKLGGRVERSQKHPYQPVIGIDFARCGKITDADLAILKEFPQLRSLNLSDTKVTDAGVKKLKGALPKCVIIH